MDDDDLGKIVNVFLVIIVALSMVIGSSIVAIVSKDNSIEVNKNCVCNCCIESEGR